VVIKGLPLVSIGCYIADMETDRIVGAPHLMKYRNAIEVIDEVLKLNPAATAREIRQHASVVGQEEGRAEGQAEQALAERGEGAEGAEARTERGTCRHCAAAIVRGNNGAWYHGDVPSWGSRGCWAHSFARLGIWDSPLDRKWHATPA
jgi:hypothetical protein